MATTRTTPALLTLNEVAVYLRVSIRTAYQLASDGAIPAVKVGGQWRIRAAQLERQLADKEPAP